METGNVELLSNSTSELCNNLQALIYIRDNNPNICNGFSSRQTWAGDEQNGSLYIFRIRG